MSQYMKVLDYDEAQKVYCDPKAGRVNYQFILAVMQTVLAGMFLALALTAFSERQFLAVAIVCYAVSAAFLAGAAAMTVTGLGRLRRPHSTVLEKNRMILREGSGYRAFTFNEIKSIEAETLGGKFSCKGSGTVDIVIKNNSISYSENKKNKRIHSDYIGKFAYVLYNVLLNPETCADWDKAYESCKVKDGDLFSVKRLYIKA